MVFYAPHLEPQFLLISFGCVTVPGRQRGSDGEGRVAHDCSCCRLASMSDAATEPQVLNCCVPCLKETSVSKVSHWFLDFTCITSPRHDTGANCTNGLVNRICTLKP